MMTPATGFQKLRFHADDGSEFPEWNKKKLSEVFSKITRKNVDRKIELVLTNSAEHGIIPQREFFDKDIASVENIDGYYILNPNDFVYNPRKSKAAPYGPFQCYYGEIPGVVSPLYTCLHPITKDCSQYLMRYFASAAWHRFVYDNGSVGARHDRVSMTDDILFNIPVEIPCLEEQQKIADFLSAYDKKNTLQRERVKTLKEQKKGLLQKMFPKKGETVPELRFPGFTGDWEQRKLGDIGSVAMCRRIFKHQTSESGEIPFFKIGTFGGEPDAFITCELFEEFKAKYPYPDKGDILISASGSIGRTVEFTGENEYFQDSNIVWLKHDKSIINPFLRHLYSVVEWAGIEGSTIKRLYNDNILKTEVMLPSVQEQTKIAEMLDGIDSLITLHQRKLETMQEIKKGLLQQMFV